MFSSFLYPQHGQVIVDRRIISIWFLFFNQKWNSYSFKNQESHPDPTPQSGVLHLLFIPNFTRPVKLIPSPSIFSKTAGGISVNSSRKVVEESSLISYG